MLHSTPKRFDHRVSASPQRAIHKEAIDSGLTITLIDKRLKLKETLTLMREIGGDRHRAVLPSPSISQN